MHRGPGAGISAQAAWQAGCWVSGNPAERLPKWSARAGGSTVAGDAVQSLDSIRILPLGATAPTVLSCGCFSPRKWTETAKGSHRAGER